MTLLERMYDARDWLSLLAAIGNLSLAVTAVVARSRSPLARPLAALAFVLFGWNFSTLVGHLLQRSGASSKLAVLDAVFTVLSPPLVLEVVLTFIGQLRQRRILRAATWLYFGALAAVSTAGLVDDGVLRWLDADAWSVAFLAGQAPSFVVAVVLLAIHLRTTIDPAEKSRTRIVLAALAIGGTFSMSDVVHGLRYPVPYLGALGTLLASALITSVVVRNALLERNVSLRTALYVGGMIAAFVAAYVVVLVSFAGHLAVQLFGVSALTVLVSAVARELALSFAETRARTLRLAALGRFAAQMSHDVKGPLSALLGAVQVLEGADDDPAERGRFLGLVGEQARRVADVLDRYDRMARVEPRKTLVWVNDVVRAAGRAHGVSDEGLSPSPIECEADAALLGSAIENVVRNAIEATADAGLVRLETGVEARGAVIRVIDRGPGMDARVLERAAEDFFSTKPDGSGLGLAFARRVVEAHGGSLTVASRPGAGTTVTLRIPL